MNDLERICYFVLAAAGLALAGCAPSSTRTADDSGPSGTGPVSPYGIPLRPREATEREAERIRRADEALAHAPDDIDALIEAALAREDVWRYSEAIELYTRGITLAPDDYRLYLGRAHRLIRLRRFDDALADLNRSAELDPYGFNTAYLRGLVHYVSGRFDLAADEYGRCMDLSNEGRARRLFEEGNVPGDPRHCMLIAADDRSRVAITAWRYRALRRAGRGQEAADLLETIPESLSLTEPLPDEYRGSIIKPDSNQHYYRVLLMYKGLLSEADLLDRAELQGQWPTVAYGVAVWHLVGGDEEGALALLREIVQTPYWARLGHVAAEADLIRLGSVAE